MLAIWRVAQIVWKAIAVMVFLMAVFFVREIVHEVYDPERQPSSPSYGRY